jgi:DnaK suppressor protein
MFVSLPQLTEPALSRAGLARDHEKEVHGRAEPLTQGINRGHDGASATTKGRFGGIEPHAAGADDARRREVKAQPKVAAKTKKPAAKAPAKAKVSKPAAKAARPKVVPPASRKVPAKAAKPVAKNTKPASKAAKPAARPATSAKSVPAKAAKTPVKAAPKATKTTAGKVVGAVAKAVVSGAKAVVAAAKNIPAKAMPAPKAAAKASPPPAAPAAKPAQTASVGAQTSKPAQAPSRSAPPAVPAPGAFGSAKATYTPMATQSVLTPPPVVAVKKDPKLANNWKTKSAEELSDAEVLAMPDTEYMNDKQMAFFRLKLLQLKTDILNSAGETTEHLREDTVIVPDPADRATIEEEHALELRTRDRERKLLKKIEQSIARIDAGDYGYCDETGEPIGVGRLLARPTATLSLEAQQRRELKQKMFGD